MGGEQEKKNEIKEGGKTKGRGRERGIDVSSSVDCLYDTNSFKIQNELQRDWFAE